MAVYKVKLFTGEIVQIDDDEMMENNSATARYYVDFHGFVAEHKRINGKVRAKDIGRLV